MVGERFIKRVIAALFVLIIATAGCQALRPGIQATTSTTREKTVLVVSLIDAKTKEKLPTSSWLLEPIVGEGETIYVENAKQNEFERIFQPMEPGTYGATATASTYFSEHKVINIKPGENSVQFALKPIPPQTSEDAVYDKLKRSFPLKVYRPKYLPVGFTIAQYAGREDLRQTNPYLSAGTEAEVEYESENSKIELRFGVKGDIGAPPTEQVIVGGNKAYVDTKGNVINILWYERIGGKEYLYIVRTQSVPKQAVIKFAESLYEVK